jgi:hypothetical protein
MTIFEQISKLIASGDSGQAISTLKSHLKAQQESELLKTLQVVEAEYGRTRDKELKGVIDANEARLSFAKINEALVEITTSLEEGRKPLLQNMPEKAANRVIYWIIGGAIVLLLGIIAGVLLKQDKPEKAENNTQTKSSTPGPSSGCPEFDTSISTVMIVPFVNEGDGQAKPEVSIQSLIRDLTGKNQMETDVKLFQGQQFKNSPPDNNEAIKIGMTCQADMVIWGTFEKTNTGINVVTRYVFTVESEISDGKISGTFKSLAELKADRSAHKNLEDAVFSLCTVMAIHNNNMDLARRWVNKIKVPSDRDKELMAMLK